MMSDVLDNFCTHSWISFLKGALYLCIYKCNNNISHVECLTVVPQHALTLGINFIYHICKCKAVLVYTVVVV